MDLSKLKLVIWDLDDSFWRGTLTEGGIIPIEANIQLIKDLTDHGVVNTICSKNDIEPVIQKLEELGVNDYFVFNSIDWTPKGPRISNLLKDMGLRAINTLFIDDNIVNLNEAKHYEPDINISEPDVIDDIKIFFKDRPITDAKHKRLDNYKVLEKKRDSKKSYSDNESFLYASNTRVGIFYDCMEKIDRIYELIQRTNQLNYTKLRSTRDELIELLKDKSINSGYVTVKDSFGDYGIVGFFAVKAGHCIHFLFSCRTIGQGVEQYVYAKLGHPVLKISGIVINDVTQADAPMWINQDMESDDIKEDKIKGKIVFKGPCDLMGLTSYLKADNLISELTYISSSRHNNLEHQGCMTNYIQIPDLSPDDIELLVNKCLFNDEELYKTSIYDDDVQLIFISSLQEFHFGIYRHKQRGVKVAFGEWNHPLTDPTEWDGYVNGSVWTSSNNFSYEFLKQFSREWEFLGRKSYDEYISEIKIFLTKISPKANVVIFLGSEIPYEGNCTEAWENRDIIHKEINRRLRAFAKTNSRIHLIDYTELITTQKDYTDSIDHMQRYIHYKAAEKANEIIKKVMGAEVKQSSKLKILLNQCRDMLTYIHVFILKCIGKL